VTGQSTETRPVIDYLDLSDLSLFLSHERGLRMLAQVHKIGIMADTLSSEARSERMSRVRAKDTKPEMIVRRLVHSLGYRYRLHGRNLPGNPDLVFAGRSKVLFVHGCFWHRHSAKTCALARLPKSRLDFWLPKLESNWKRDRRNRYKLTQLGWEALVIWECQMADLERLETRIVKRHSTTRT
jgi:DNA mismatch endonuclease (patch repair protein)